MKINNNIVYFIVILTGLIVLSGCGNSESETQGGANSPSGQPNTKVAGGEALSGDTSKDSNLTSLKVPLSTPTTPDILLVGDSLGFYREKGIQLDFVGLVPAAQHIAAVISGDINVTPGSHINRTIAGISAGAKVLAVVGKTETSERLPHMVGIIKKNSPIKKPTDLVGKTIGIPMIGGCNEYTPYAYLDKFGIDDPKNKIEITVIPENNLEQALRQGEIDLAMLHSTPEEINRDGEFDILFTDYDVWGTDGGGTPLVFSTQYISEHPDVVRSFVSATVKPLNWINENNSTAGDITAKYYKIDRNQVSDRYFVPNGIIKEETITIWTKLLRDFDEIKDNIPLEKIYTNEYNEYYQ
jgi:ABC-type nitrate/sulfonate/bicarbonate transport system substrate-binding protein